MLEDISTGTLVGVLLLLVVVSAFFSGSETGLISLNRYRLRHLAQEGNRGARRAQKLLDRPDRLIGLILLGNNFVNILASIIAGIIGTRLFGPEAGLLITTITFTAVVLIFAEVTPKTLAALHPERLAFPAAIILTPLLKVTYPFVWVINGITAVLLRIVGLSSVQDSSQALSREELRTVVSEAGAMIPQRHQKMLLSILDLEKVTVEDIMIPRNEIVGINLDDDWDTIIKQLTTTQHTRLPLYRGDIDNVEGFLHMRNFLSLHRDKTPQPEDLQRVVRAPYFIPEATPLNSQLLNFQRERRRIGLVVDEYGDIQGLVTLDDILEEIVGEFTTDPSTMIKEIHPQEDGTYLVDGSANIREVNRIMAWELPADEAKTLNGMILEYLESIPEAGTSVLINGYPIEIVKTGRNTIKKVRIDPGFRKQSQDD